MSGCFRHSPSELTVISSDCQARQMPYKMLNFLNFDSLFTPRAVNISVNDDGRCGCNSFQHFQTLTMSLMSLKGILTFFHPRSAR